MLVVVVGLLNDAERFYVGIAPGVLRSVETLLRSYHGARSHTAAEWMSAGTMTFRCGRVPQSQSGALPNCAAALGLCARS